ncbi:MULTISPECIES: HAD hydrolase-like protein [unclassified Butyrivibrio]|uniref:HAD hydrolase-like protein n=1 Tax=unclassified Butyrivibrio TaxID=2639466 RepID=UPI00040E7DB5|nr:MULTISPECIES: HAD hydrolase-like protein [unclassified Butyrivibrio]
MIGDTKFDIKGASEAGVDSIAVTYGYGKVEEMKEAGATYIADSAQAVAGFLGVSI